MPLRINKNVNQTPRTLTVDVLNKNRNTPANVSKAGIYFSEKRSVVDSASDIRNSGLSDATFERNESTAGYAKRYSNFSKPNSIPVLSRKISAPSIVKLRRNQPRDFKKKTKVVHTSDKDQVEVIDISDSLSMHLSAKEDLLSASPVSGSSDKQQQSSIQPTLPCTLAPRKEPSKVDQDNNKLYDTKDLLAKAAKKQSRKLVRSVSAQPIFVEKNDKGVSPARAARYKVGAVSSAKPSSYTSDIGAHTEQLDQMEAVMDYIKHISEALARRTRSLPPPAHLDTFRATITPQARQKPMSGEKNAGNHTNNMLSNLREAATMLLAWFSKVEYLNVSQNESLRNLELQTLSSGASVLGLVEAVERNFLTHELSVVREAFFSSGGYLVVTECRELIEAMTQTAQHIALLRQLVHERDLFRVRDLFEMHKDTIKKRLDNASSRRSVQYQEEMLKGPFFIWLERRWLPAMRSWRRIVLEARQIAISGDVQAALAHSQNEAFAVAALQDILRPGETIQDLHRTQIEIPILELAKMLEKKEESMNTLQAVMQRNKMATNTDNVEPGTSAFLVELDKAIQSCRDVTDHDNYRGPADEQMGQILAEAEKLLLDMQEVEKIRQALAAELATDGSGGGVPLFLQIHRANELIHRLHLAESASDAHNIVSSCQTAVAKFVEADANSIKAKYKNRHSSRPAFLVDLLPPNITVHEVALAHMPSHVWPLSMVTLYKQACSRLLELFAHETARRGPERTLGSITGASMSPISEVAGTPNPKIVHSIKADDESSAITDSTIRRYESSRHSVLSERSAIASLEAQLRHSDKSALLGPIPPDLRSSLARTLTLKLKVHFEAQTRIVHVHEADKASFEDVSRRLYRQCCELFSIMHRSQSSPPPGPRRLRIRYEDTDGDFITLLTDEDWRVMLSELHLGSNLHHSDGGDAPRVIPTKLEVYCDFILLPEENADDSTQAAALASGKENETNVGCIDSEIADMNDESVSCAPTGPQATVKKMEKMPHESPAMMRLEALKRTLLLNSGDKNISTGCKGRVLIPAGRSRSAQPSSNTSSKQRGRSGRKPEVLPSSERENLSPQISRNRAAKSALRDVSPRRGFPLTTGNLLQHRSGAAILKEKISSNDASSKSVGYAEKDPTPLVHEDPVDLDKFSPQHNPLRLDLYTNKRWDQEGEDETVLEMQTAASMLTCATNRSTVILTHHATEGNPHRALPVGEVGGPPRFLTPPPPETSASSPLSEAKGAGATATVEGRGVAPSTRPPLPNPRLQHASPMSRYARPVAATETEVSGSSESDEESFDPFKEAIAARHRDPAEVLQEMRAMREENQRALHGRKLMWQS